MSSLHTRSPRSDQAGWLTSAPTDTRVVPSPSTTTRSSAPVRSSTQAVPSPGSDATWRSEPELEDGRGAAQ